MPSFNNALLQNHIMSFSFQYTMNRWLLYLNRVIDVLNASSEDSCENSSQKYVFKAITHKKYSTASDVWSFGVLMYEIWSLGHKPFEGVSNHEVSSKQECLTFQKE